MEKLANIVTDYPSSNFPGVFNVVSDYKEIAPSVPTIIIGLETARSVIPDFNILKKSYDGDMTWWTFRKNERHAEYDDDMEGFYRFVFERFSNTVSFRNVNPLTLTKSGVRRCLSFILNGDRKYCFFTRDKNYVFVYWRRKRMVLGFSLSTCEYCGFDRERVSDIIRSNRNNWTVGYGDFAGRDIRGAIGCRTHLIPAMYEYFQTK